MTLTPTTTMQMPQEVVSAPDTLLNISQADNNDDAIDNNLNAAVIAIPRFFFLENQTSQKPWILCYYLGHTQDEIFEHCVLHPH